MLPLKWKREAIRLSMETMNDARFKIPYVFSFQGKSEEPCIYASPEDIEDLGFRSVGDQNH